MECWSVGKMESWNIGITVNSRNLTESDVGGPVRVKPEKKRILNIEYWMLNWKKWNIVQWRSLHRFVGVGRDSQEKWILNY